ncbi:hypothetical protein [Glutamicibacter sp. BSL13]
MSNNKTRHSIRVVDVLQHGLHCEVEVPDRVKCRIVVRVSSGQTLPVALPDALASSQSGLSGRILQVLRGRFGNPQWIYRTAKSSQPAKISVTTHSGSVEIEENANEFRQLVFRRRGGKEVAKGNVIASGASSFAINEFEPLLTLFPDGESLWDCGYGLAKDSRLSYSGKVSSEPRKNLIYPWFWMANDLAVVKAKVYWTKDAHLAMKVVKKGIRKA